MYNDTVDELTLLNQVTTTYINDSRVLRRYGRIDILVTNEGGPPSGYFGDLDADLLSNVYRPGVIGLAKTRSAQVAADGITEVTCTISSYWVAAYRA